jgi:hypothetical protein
MASWGRQRQQLYFYERGSWRLIMDRGKQQEVVIKWWQAVEGRLLLPRLNSFEMIRKGRHVTKEHTSPSTPLRQTPLLNTAVINTFKLCNTCKHQINIIRLLNTVLLLLHAKRQFLATDHSGKKNRRPSSWSTPHYAFRVSSSDNTLQQYMGDSLFDSGLEQTTFSDGCCGFLASSVRHLMKLVWCPYTYILMHYSATNLSL